MKYELRGKSDEYNFIEQLLQNRGIEDVKAFLNVGAESEIDPANLDNIDEGSKLLCSHLEEKDEEHICVIVDDDGDGFLSSALLYFYLEAYDVKKITFLFHETKFHGIELEKIPTDCTLLIVPDAGSSDYEQQVELSKRGIDILILDHHQVTEVFPKVENVVIINNQTSPRYENKNLCGAGIVYKFIKYFDENYGRNFSDEKIDVTKWLDLVAIAIVGDVMGLETLENRYYLNVGLSNIENPFFVALVRTRSYNIGTGPVKPVDVAFYLMPAINAIVRVGTLEEKRILFNAIVDGEIIVNSTKRGHLPNETEVLKDQAIRLCNNAIAHQKRERTKIAELLQERIQLEEGEDNKIVIGKFFDDDNINSNLTGLAAMELATHYQRPALVLKYNEENDCWSGSARNFGSSISDLKEFILSTGLAEYAAGHMGAFGCSISDQNLPEFINIINKKLESVNYTADNFYWVDLITNSKDEYLSTIIKEIDRNKSLWGHNVEEPIICVENITLSKDEIISMGANADSVKFIKNGVSYVKFKDLDFFDLLTRDDNITITVVGRANVNEWNGRITPQIFIDDYNVEDIYEF